MAKAEKGAADRALELAVLEALRYQPYSGMTQAMFDRKTDIQPGPVPDPLTKARCLAYVSTPPGCVGAEELGFSRREEELLEWLFRQHTGVGNSDPFRSGEYRVPGCDRDVVEMEADERVAALERLAGLMQARYDATREEYTDALVVSVHDLPNTHEKIGFGKYKGESFAGAWILDPGYCEWAAALPCPRSAPLIRFSTWCRKTVAKLGDLRKRAEAEVERMLQEEKQKGAVTAGAALAKMFRSKKPAAGGAGKAARATAVKREGVKAKPLAGGATVIKVE